jgi:hypothetical protein
LRAIHWIALFGLGALIAPARSLAAQRVRGQVVLPDSTTPAAGVIVVATGDNGAPVRALTAGRGAFDLALPRAGRFELRVLRIGFAPTLVPGIDVAAGETKTIRVVLGAERISLSRVTVRGKDECDTRRDAGLLVTRVWEETRKALMASQLVADNPLVAEWIQYDRHLEPNSTRVWQQHVRTTKSPTTHAFVSRPAESLAELGYIVEDSTTREFFAPDAEVLLSESFSNLHCFHLEPPPAGHPGFIGLGFKPRRGARNVKDIEGTLWLDRESAELQWLEYHYTNLLDAEERAGTGGRVEFLRLASGEWLVSRWNILMPPALPAQSTDTAGSAVPANPDASKKSVQITGGQVISVARGDSLLYRAKVAGLNVQLIARESAITVAGATVTLLGTDYMVKADSAGRARVSPVLEGRYRAKVLSPLMDSLGAAGVERDVEIREGVEHVDSIALPRMFELIRAGCKGEPLSENESLLHGTVHDTAGRPVAHAAVTVTFQTGISTVGGRMSYSGSTIGSLTNELGLWRICGVPQGKPVSVRVVTDDGADSKRFQMDEGQAVGGTDLVISRSKLATVAAMSGSADSSGVVTDSSGAPGTATVEISVSTRDGKPVPDAAVEILPASGPTRTVRTQASGHALVPGVKPGIMRVRARSVGLKAGEIVVRVMVGRNTVPIRLDVAKSPALDTVRVMGGRVLLARYREFEDRLAQRLASAAFTEEDIEKVNPVETYQMLNRVTSVRLIPNGGNGGQIPISNRGMRIDSKDTGTQAVPCYMSVAIDGVMMMPTPPDLAFDVTRLPAPSQIHGIEVFAGASSIPGQYNGAGGSKMCGLIIIWTR